MITIRYNSEMSNLASFSNLAEPIALSKAKQLHKAFSLGLLEIEHDKLENLEVQTNEPKEVFEVLKDCFDEYIKAGGGLVRNKKGEILFIFRKGKWDLPKGKIEKGETIKEGAHREVMEECGIHQLKIRDKITSTYHAYEMKKKSVLKKTNWYLMYSEATEFTPQEEEDITKVRWIKEDKLDKVYKNTYRNIKKLLHEYYENTSAKK